jgi:biopolymer transport protein ExbB
MELDFAQMSEDMKFETHSDPRSQLLQKLKGAPADKVDSLFIAFCNQAQKRWSKGFQVLGTLGSTTPFIGLLGTILGIIVSFGELSAGGGDMNTVMFSLAEALLLTAAGLGVAIPSVIAYNIFNARVQSMLEDLESVKELYKVQL